MLRRTNKWCQFLGHPVQTEAIALPPSLMRIGNKYDNSNVIKIIVAIWHHAIPNDMMPICSKFSIINKWRVSTEFFQRFAGLETMNPVSLQYDSVITTVQ